MIKKLVFVHQFAYDYDADAGEKVSSRSETIPGRGTDIVSIMKRAEMGLPLNVAYNGRLTEGDDDDIDAPGFHPVDLCEEMDYMRDRLSKLEAYRSNLEKQQKEQSEAKVTDVESKNEVDAGA